MTMDFACYLNLIEQKIYELQRFQQQIWQPWRDAHYLGKKNLNWILQSLRFTRTNIMNINNKNSNANECNRNESWNPRRFVCFEKMIEVGGHTLVACAHFTMISDSFFVFFLELVFL